MAKYDPLSRHFKGQRESSVTLSFAEIEDIIGTKLPPSARSRREWWWTDKDVSSITHVQCRAWLRNGYVTGMVNLDTERVTFLKEATRSVQCSIHDA